MQDIFNQQSLTQAGELGRLQADAQKPSGLQKFGQIAGGLGSLFGGVGGLVGGFSGLGKKKPAGTY